MGLVSWRSGSLFLSSFLQQAVFRFVPFRLLSSLAVFILFYMLRFSSCFALLGLVFLHQERSGRIVVLAWALAHCGERSLSLPLAFT
jgi:hypothetical protein